MIHHADVHDGGDDTGRGSGARKSLPEGPGQGRPGPALLPAESRLLKISFSLPIMW